MKKDKIYKLFSKGRLTLLNSVGEDGEIKSQYITDGAAIFPLENLPIFDEVTIGGLIGGNTETMMVETLPNPMLLEIILAYSAPGDTPLDFCRHTLFDFSCFSTYHNSDGDGTPEEFYFVDRDYTKPLDDETELEFFARTALDGKRIIIARSGMLFKAAIMPVYLPPVLCERYADFLEKAAAELRKELRESEGND